MSTKWKHAPLRWVATVWSMGGSVVERHRQSSLTVGAAWIVGGAWTIGGIWLIFSGEALWGWPLAIIGVVHLLAAALHGWPKKRRGDY